MRRWLTRRDRRNDHAPVETTARRVLMSSRLHFIAADLREDWLSSIDWDATVRSILVRGA